MLRGIAALGASEGHRGTPGPTRNRALAHQGDIDLFAGGPPIIANRRNVSSTRVGPRPVPNSQWIAGVYLGVGGGALAFILWVMALERATPTRVASTMTVNPIAAALLAHALVGEPITLNLVIGLVAVFAGIWIATTEPARARAPET